MSVEMAGEPEYHNGMAVFTYKTSKPVRYVAARFEHEDYKNLHVYRRNQHDVFFLVYPLPENYNLLKYRIVVDGLWMRDPYNPVYVRGGVLDTDYSIYTIEKRVKKRVQNPEWQDHLKFRFVYGGLPGQRVSIIGDFNNWDPFSHPLISESGEPGRYSIDCHIGLGRHYYAFVVNGVRIADPYNINRMVDSGGKPVSYFDAPP